MLYHLTGFASAFFVVLSLVGTWTQLQLVLSRRKLYESGEGDGEKPTEILSIYRFLGSYVAFYTMFFYGLTLERFNHYIVWPRVVAMFLLMMILHQIYKDFRDTKTRYIFIGSITFFIAAVILAFSEYRVAVQNTGSVYAVILFGLIVYLYGSAHQNMKVRKNRKTGALSLRMHQLYAIKDFTSIAFGIAMGVLKGWPIWLFHGVCLVVQLITMWHFRWVKKEAYIQAE